jgi:hypothetical protein
LQIYAYIVRIFYSYLDKLLRLQIKLIFKEWYVFYFFFPEHNISPLCRQLRARDRESYNCWVLCFGAKSHNKGACFWSICGAYPRVKSDSWRYTATEGLLN